MDPNKQEDEQSDYFLDEADDLPEDFDFESDEESNDSLHPVDPIDFEPEFIEGQFFR